MRVMAAPRKYPDELRERATRMAVDARRDPATRPGALALIGKQLGINPETLRNWVTQAEIDQGTRQGLGKVAYSRSDLRGSAWWSWREGGHGLVSQDEGAETFPDRESPYPRWHLPPPACPATRRRWRCPLICPPT